MPGRYTDSGLKNRKDKDMMGNLGQDWPVYLLLGAVVFFFGYVVIKGNQAQKEKKVEQESHSKRSNIESEK